MAIIVKKFGGTSVGDIGRIKHVAKLIADFKLSHPEDALVIVVSAMAGETNRLIALAKSCVKEPSPRELDVLSATGEQVTVALLSMALMELGLKAKSLLAHQAGIYTDGHHLEAKIAELDRPKIQSLLGQGEIAVVAGFQGVSPSGDVTTLGRGGSDITAVALAAAFNAQACYIYTDVEGVYATDPRLCPNTPRLDQISHEEMLEMASLGAKVLHPRSVYFAMQYGVPLVVLSTFNPTPKTWIVKEEDLMERPVVSGITYRLDEAKLTLHGLPGDIGALSYIFNLLAKNEISIDMITQTGTTDGRTDISFTIPDELSSQALSLVEACVPELKAEGASLDRDIAKVSIIGVGIKHHAEVPARMFGALAKERINVQMISTSQIKISVLVKRKYGEVAVRTLHETFFEMSPQTSREVSSQHAA